MCAALVAWASVVFSPTAGLAVLGSLSNQWKQIGNSLETHLFWTSSVLGGEELLRDSLVISLDEVVWFLDLHF